MKLALLYPVKLYVSDPPSLPAPMLSMIGCTIGEFGNLLDKSLKLSYYLVGLVY